MNAEQRLLLQKAEESMQAAQLLADNSLYDFAASRAYYTMFYIAQAFLLGGGLTFSSHAAVIGAFGKEFARTNQLPTKFHRYLIDAAQLRAEGDYSTARKVTEQEALEVIVQAAEFITLAQTEM
ncbi:MAG: HEPN domain-containing protein [Cyanobacteria bacterium P01_A01_bin.114]